MAILVKQVVKAWHWYTRSGKAAHRQPNAKGTGDRTTTIRDARRLGLLPSVTSILGIIAKPGLDEWRLNQVALAANRCPITEGESVEYWAKRVKEAAFEQVETAAELGGRIHGALEMAFAGEPWDPDLEPYVRPVMEWMMGVGIVPSGREVVLVNEEHGFAGTADVLFLHGSKGIGILDYKTRKTRPGERVTAYDGQAMQLAAYAATHYGEAALERVLAANVFISTTEPGRMEVVKHGDLRTHWEAFLACAALWRYLKGYDPRSGGQ